MTCKSSNPKIFLIRKSPEEVLQLKIGMQVTVDVSKVGDSWNSLRLTANERAMLQAYPVHFAGLKSDRYVFSIDVPCDRKPCVFMAHGDVKELVSTKAAA